jgi:ribosomal protein S12 methylthiotransferase accessory factor
VLQKRLMLSSLESKARWLQKVPGSQRTVAPDETYSRVYGEACALGVTRLGDITGMDRIGVPAYCAIVPRSRDIISVYTGKGLDRIDAKVGALMEAVERQTVLNARSPMVVGSVETLRKEYCVLDPREVLLELLPDYSVTHEYSWVFGHDLVSQREVLVPAALAGYFWQDLLPGPFVRISFTNGLASGNVKEEAVCQALCELIERDAWTLADIGAHQIPRVRRLLIDPETADVGEDDFEMFESLELEGDPVMVLFERAGLRPVLHDITSDIAIPTVFAAVLDEAFPGMPMIHAGLGTHPDARVAVTRALTEAAQSRCVDIQGVREDLCPPETELSSFNAHTRRISQVNRRLWVINESSVRKGISALPSAVYDNVQEDVDHILCHLQRQGINRVIVVDFTPPNAPFAVVRVIVPELESWSVNRAKLGRRALDFWGAHV